MRSELGLDKRVQLGQVERKWEDHPSSGTSTHVALTTGWGGPPLWRNEMARQREVMSVHSEVKRIALSPAMPLVSCAAGEFTNSLSPKFFISNMMKMRIIMVPAGVIGKI